MLTLHEIETAIKERNPQSLSDEELIQLGVWCWKNSSLTALETSRLITAHLSAGRFLGVSSLIKAQSSIAATIFNRNKSISSGLNSLK